MPSPAVSRPYLIPLLMGLGLIMTGCATPSAPEGAGPEVSDRPSAPVPAKTNTDEEKEIALPMAPLMPSVFFSGGAERFESWRCVPAQDLVSAFPEGELRLWSAHGAYRLEPAVVASGSRYGKDDLSFWHQGDTARVESDNGRLECERDMMRQALSREERPGVMFHGRGNEPGWVVNLAHDRPQLDLILDYGDRELTLPYRVAAMDSQGGRAVLMSGRADQSFRLQLDARACFDSMSGAPYPVRVTLEMDDQVYQGCGQGIAP